MIDRFRLQETVEKTVFNKDETIWYLRDMAKGKHGRIIAKFWYKWIASEALELANKKRKTRNSNLAASLGPKTMRKARRKVNVQV